MRIAILGGPGSGKGTQAKMLAEKYRVPQISTGDLLRDAAENDKGIDKQIKQAMGDGLLVDDELVLKLLDERIRRKDTKRGFIIDGYPRNIPQAQTLDRLLGMIGRPLQIAINVDVDDSILVKRITGRENCGNCGAIYNKFFYPSKVAGKCDACQSNLVARMDDTEKALAIRIQVYHEETTPLITYYKAQHKLRTVSGEGETIAIHDKLCSLIDLEVRPLEVMSVEISGSLGDERKTTLIAGGQINKVSEDDSAGLRMTKTIQQSGVSALQLRKKIAKKKGRKQKSTKLTVKENKKIGTKKTVSKSTPTKKTTAKRSIAKPISAKKKVSKKAVLKKIDKKSEGGKQAKQVNKKKSSKKK